MKDKLYISFLTEREVSIWQPETEIYFDALGIPFDTTVYYPSTAYEINGEGLWNALNTFVVDVKNFLGLALFNNNLSDAFKFIYPRIGGTAARHAVNLVDGTSGTFNGGWTHDGSGALPNGTNGYFDTGKTMLGWGFTRLDISFGFDSKTDTTGSYADFGCIDNTSAAEYDIAMYAKVNTNLYSRLGGLGVNNLTAISDSLGLISMKRDNGTDYTVYQEGSVLGTPSQTVTAYVSDEPIVEAALSGNGTIIQYSPRKRTLFFGGNSLSDADMVSLAAAWRTLEIVLNR